MGDKPLTPEQVCFATKNHRLIFRFLNRQQLSKEEYYDIAVFGYLKAVRDYYSRIELRQYAFSTICWRYMSREIYNYHQSLQRQLRLANVVCTRAGEVVPIECLNPYGYQEMAKMEERLLLYELSTHLPEQTFRIVKLYCAGHTIREIAKCNEISMKQVREALQTAYDTLIQLCYTNQKEESTNEPGQTDRNVKRKSCTPHPNRAQGHPCP